MATVPNLVIGISTYNVKAGDIATMEMATYPVWSNYTSTPINDLINVRRSMQYVGYGSDAIWCSSCGNAVGKGLVALHVCINEYSAELIATRITCVTLNFCAPACEVMWSLKNAEWLQEGLHGQGYRLKNIDEQMKYFSCPANRTNPYMGIPNY